MPDNRHTIRNLDPDLLLEARILAIQTGTTLGDIVNQSLEIMLSESGEVGEPEFAEDEE